MPCLAGGKCTLAAQAVGVWIPLPRLLIVGGLMGVGGKAEGE